MTPETKQKNKVKKYIDGLVETSKGSIWCYKANDRYTSGIPDIIGCVKGRLFAIENKAPGKKSKGIQKETLDAIEKAGGYVLRDADEMGRVKSFFVKILWEISNKK
jgi:hypothetical protein